MSGGSLVDRLVPDSDEEESMVFQNSPPSLFPEGLACTRSQALDRILGESSEEECARCRKEWSEGWVPQGVQLDEEDGLGSGIARPAGTHMARRRSRRLRRRFLRRRFLTTSLRRRANSFSPLTTGRRGNTAS
jgi:hypothetical protein